MCLLSKKALQNFSTLKSDSNCDNVLLEHRLALELRESGLIDKVFPVIIGEPVNGNSAEYKIDWQTIWPQGSLDVCVKAVEDNLALHMDSQALGTPLVSDRTILSVLAELKKIQGALIEDGVDGAFLSAAERIYKLCKPTEKATDVTKAFVVRTYLLIQGIYDIF